MSRFTALILLIISLMITTSLQVKAQISIPSSEKDGAELSGDITTNFSSQYIWRGQEYNSEFVFIPSLRLNQNGIELAALGVVDMTDSNDLKGKFTQWIFQGGMAKRTPIANFGIFYKYYYYPEHNHDKTQEVAMEMRWGEDAFFSLDIYWDFDKSEGLYGRAGLGYTLLLDPLILEPLVTVGGADSKYLEEYYGVDETSFCDLVASVKADINLAGGFFITSKVSYYQLLTSDLRQATMATREGDFWWYELGGKLTF